MDPAAQRPSPPDPASHVRARSLLVSFPAYTRSPVRGARRVKMESDGGIREQPGWSAVAAGQPRETRHPGRNRACSRFDLGLGLGWRDARRGRDHGAQLLLQRAFQRHAGSPRGLFCQPPPGCRPVTLRASSASRSPYLYVAAGVAAGALVVPPAGGVEAVAPAARRASAESDGAKKYSPALTVTISRLTGKVWIPDGWCSTSCVSASNSPANGSGPSPGSAGVGGGPEG